MAIDLSGVPGHARLTALGHVLSAAGNWTRADQDTAANYTTLLRGATAPATTTATPLLRLVADAATTALANASNEREETAPQLSNSALVKVYVLSIMALLSLLGNVLTMWNIYKTRLARRSSRHSWSAIYKLIFHLSIADLLVTGFCIVGEAVWSYTVQWLAGELACKLVKLFQMFSLYLSTYVLVLIGVDRWIAVKYPMKSLNMAKRCYRLLGGTYILSFLLSLPQFFIFHVARGPFIEEFHQCVTHGFYTAVWQEQLYATFTLVFTFLLPLCILFGTYLSTFRTISSSEKMFQGFKLAAYPNQSSAQTNRQRLIHKAKMKSLRISVVIIFAFLICWTPYYVMMMIFLFSNPDKRQSDVLNSAIFVFGMSNSLVNPLIYGAFHLCPMDRKASKSGSHNNAHSLNRGDSQRTMFTAVTQVDGSGRQLRSYRQPNYYRTHSNSSSSYKEHVSLLQVATPTPSIMSRKSASVRNPPPHYQPSHSLQILAQHHQHHQHQQKHDQPALTHTSMLLANGTGAPQSALVLNFRPHKSTATALATLRANSSGSLNGGAGNKPTAVGSAGNTSLVFLCAGDKSVSSV